MDRIQSKAARLSRLERLLYNAPQGLRVADLAERSGVDRRTIYRDLFSLEEMGVPIWEDAGRYGITRERYLSTVRLNLNEAIALYFAYYNLCRVHATLKTTPAVASGLTDHVWSVAELLEKAARA